MRTKFRMTQKQLDKVKNMLGNAQIPVARYGVGNRGDGEQICYCIADAIMEENEAAEGTDRVSFRTMNQLVAEKKCVIDIEEKPVKDSKIICYVGETIVKAFYKEDNDWQMVDVVMIVGERITFYAQEQVEYDAQMTQRTAQVFGRATVELLKKMKIGVAGVSGTGSIVVEQLLRLGVGELVLVDDDVMEERNLNRIINAKRTDALEKKYKVDMIADFAREAGFQTKIIPFRTLIACKETSRELAQCDVLFGCLDSVDGRHHMNMLSTAYLIPYFDVGVKLVADGMGGIEEITVASHYLQPGGSSLMSRKVYDSRKLQAASLKRENPEEYQKRLQEKYIVGAKESSPAVISVNMMAAGMAVLEFLSRIHPYRAEELADIETIRMDLAGMRIIAQQESAVCQFFQKYLGTGDENSLVKAMG